MRFLGRWRKREQESEFPEDFFRYGDKIAFIRSDCSYRLESTLDQYQAALQQASTEGRSYPEEVGTRTKILLGDTPPQDWEINFMSVRVFPDDNPLGLLLSRNLSPDIPQATLNPKEEERLRSNIPEE